MLERLIRDRLIYKLDFIDLNILEELVRCEYFIAFSVLVKKLRKINVWERGIIRRRVTRLKDMKIIYFEEHRNPLIIEAYDHKDQEIKEVRDKLKSRLVRYR